MGGKPRYAQIELPDDFEKGACSKCPLSYSEIDGFDGVETKCVLDYHWRNCNLKIKEKKSLEEISTKMRNATEEERKAIDSYIKSISISCSSPNFNKLLRGVD